eukprot:1550248-Rhodomonas_salina.2
MLRLSSCSTLALSREAATARASRCRSAASSCLSWADTAAVSACLLSFEASTLSIHSPIAAPSTGFLHRMSTRLPISRRCFMSAASPARARNAAPSNTLRILRSTRSASCLRRCAHRAACSNPTKAVSSAARCALRMLLTTVISICCFSLACAALAACSSSPLRTIASSCTLCAASSHAENALPSSARARRRAACSYRALARCPTCTATDSPWKALCIATFRCCWSSLLRIPLAYACHPQTRLCFIEVVSRRCANCTIPAVRSRRMHPLFADIAMWSNTACALAFVDRTWKVRHLRASDFDSCTKQLHALYVSHMW